MDNGRIAYEAYVEHCGGKSIRGEQLPTWDDQAPEIREHWAAAAEAVLRAQSGSGLNDAAGSKVAQVRRDSDWTTYYLPEV